MTHVHFIGIGGSGLSAIARLLREQGYVISGSDRALSPLAAELQKDGITVCTGHAPQNITGADWVVRSSAIPDDNPEVLAARKAGIPVYKRADFLGSLMAPPEKDGIAIAGTHGKTTTTAMIAWALAGLGAQPSFIIGGVSQNFGVNAHVGSGRAFVIEADEYDRMFLGLRPRFAVITNIEHDHPDIYPTAQEFFDAFRQFIRLIPENGALVTSTEDAGSTMLAEEARHAGIRVIDYYIQQKDSIRHTEWIEAVNVRPNATGGYSFDIHARISGREELVQNIQLSVPGLHNVRNSLATLGIVGLMGYRLGDAAASLAEYKGTGRRFEVKGEAGGVTVIDDYAHHPTAIRATLDAARARYPSRRIWAVWQPHTYSRTMSLFDEFASSFGQADEVIVSEIYAAREPVQPFSAGEVVHAMKHKSAHFIPAIKEISAYLISHLQSGDVLIVMSAGDAEQIGVDVLSGLQA